VEGSSQYPLSILPVDYDRINCLSSHWMSFSGTLQLVTMLSCFTVTRGTKKRGNLVATTDSKRQAQCLSIDAPPQLFCLCPSGRGGSLLLPGLCAGGWSCILARVQTDSKGPSLSLWTDLPVPVPPTPLLPTIITAVPKYEYILNFHTVCVRGPSRTLPLSPH
jgi:hypothetical protein